MKQGSESRLRSLKWARPGVHSPRPQKGLAPRLFGLIIACVAALPACVANGETTTRGSATPREAEALTFDAATASPNVMAAPVTTVPSSLRFWEDQGLAVHLAFSEGSTAALQQLVSGSADVVSAGLNAVYASSAQAPDLRVISLVATNVWRISVPGDSSVREVSHLEGKTIGVQSLTSGGFSYGRAIVQAAGLDPEGDVTWLPVGQGAQAAEALESGRVDAYSSYDGPLEVVADLTSTSLTPLASELDSIAGSLGVVTLKQTLEERPEAIVKFLRGMYQGLLFGQENPEATVQIHWDEYPDQEPAGADRGKSIAAAIKTSHKHWSARSAPGDDNLRGFLTTAKVAEAAEFFMTYKIVEGNADPELTVDLSLVKAANEFDEDAVKKQAQQWKP